jgi:hypothetical protein
MLSFGWLTFRERETGLPLPSSSPNSSPFPKIYLCQKNSPLCLEIGISFCLFVLVFGWGCLKVLRWIIGWWTYFAVGLPGALGVISRSVAMGIRVAIQNPIAGGTRVSENKMKRRITST